jgi:hypothetical protein
VHPLRRPSCTHTAEGGESGPWAFRHQRQDRPSHQTAAFGTSPTGSEPVTDTRLSFGLKGGVNIYQADLAGLSHRGGGSCQCERLKGSCCPISASGCTGIAPRYYLGRRPRNCWRTSWCQRHRGDNASRSPALFPDGWLRARSFGRDLKFKPSFMFRVSRVHRSRLDVNANFLLRERIWFGAMYRLGNAFGVLGQYQVNDQFRSVMPSTSPPHARGLQRRHARGDVELRLPLPEGKHHFTPLFLDVMRHLIHPS